MQVRWNAIVVGGGIAGLAAAACLRRSGLSVLLIERSSALGGRARTQESDGFRFNLGPHAFFRGGAGERLLRELGVPIEGNPPPRRALLVDDRGVHLLPASPWAILATRSLSFAEKFEVAKILGRLEKTIPSDRMTVQEWLGMFTARPRVRSILRTVLRLSTYADDIEHASAGATLRQLLQGATHGVLYLHGGWKTLVEGLERAAPGLVRRTAQPVRRVMVEGGRAQGVVLDSGEEIPADGVVLAVGPEIVTRLMPEASLPRMMPVRASCLDLALNLLPDPETLLALGADPPLYFAVHSASARLAPGEGALVHVARYGGGDRSELEAFCDRLQPGWRDHVVRARFLPRMTVSNALVTAEGNGLQGRPGPEVPGVEGIALAGDWVGPEGMLADASLASAQRAARIVARSARLRLGLPA